MSIEANIHTSEKPSVSESNTPKPNVESAPVLNFIVAIVVMIVLFGGAIWTAAVMFDKEVANRQAGFETVIQLSAEDLEGKSVEELRGYLQDVKLVGVNAGIYGNSSGYDKEIVEREHKQINDLIKYKTDI